MIEAPQVPELIALGYLVGTRTYAPIDPDLTGVHTVAGDYVEDATRRPHGSRRTDWRHRHPLAQVRRAAVARSPSASTSAHSIHLCDEFVRAGVRAEHIDGSTPKDERDATLARLASGEIRGCLQLHGAD